MRTTLAALFLVLLASAALAAGPRGQGGVVIRNDAPVYAHPTGPEVEWKLKRGEPVSGYMKSFPNLTYQFEERDGRVHVAYLRSEAGSGDRHAWMDPKDLARFTFEGDCGFSNTPYAVIGVGKLTWNVCFQEARDNKLEALRVTWAAQDAAAKPASVSATAPAPTAAPATSAPATSVSAPPPATK
jgi:hypothetical protein